MFAIAVWDAEGRFHIILGYVDALLGNDREISNYTKAVSK
jgi:hypothetical protein